MRLNSPLIEVRPNTLRSQLLNDELRRYQAIVDNPKYAHFTRIPERIMRCLDHFQVSFDRETVGQKLLAHYLFIAVVDEAIDSGQPGIAEIIFESLGGPSSHANAISLTSDVLLVTEILKRHIENGAYSEMQDRLQQAYQEVCAERAATSIGDYLEHRKALGRLTAEQSYLLIRSALNEGNDELCRLMQDVGAVGCLVDSIIDLRHDSSGGLLNFKPAFSDYARLWFCTVVEGLRVWIRKPSLSLLFVEAIIDTIRDREGVRASRIELAVVNEREDRVATVT